MKDFFIYRIFVYFYLSNYAPGIDSTYGGRSPRPGVMEVILGKTVKRRMIKPEGSCDGPATSVKHCESACFLEQIKMSEECRCTPVWDPGFNDSNPPECSFKRLANENCFNFIKNLKINLTRTCNCKIPCEEIEIKQQSNRYHYGLNGEISSLLTGKVIKTLVHEIPENSEHHWNKSLQNYFNNESRVDHASLNNDYLTKMLKTYSLRTGKSFAKTTSMYKEVLSATMHRVDVFFEDMVVNHEIEVPSDSVSSMISDFGGQLGLWIGISITSVLEIIFLLCWCFRHGGYGRKPACHHDS